MEEEKLFAQKELDEIVKKRLERQHKKHMETIRSIIKALTHGEVKE